MPGPVLSLSTQCIKGGEQVEVLALCAGQNERDGGGSLLAVLSLPARNLAGILLTYHIYSKPLFVTDVEVGVSVLHQTSILEVRD